MVFDSLTFVVFFATTLGLFAWLPTWRMRKWLLLVASYLFYAAWNPPFVALLAISTAVDDQLARRMAACEVAWQRRIFLGLSLGVNLGLLSYFKYGTFLAENFCAFVGGLGWELKLADSSIVLPVGISFYTFQTLSYTIDVYRRRLLPYASRLDFALYVSFFPQLVAGPIVRARDFLPQCETAKRLEPQRLYWGCFLITVGLFQKTVLADALLAEDLDHFYPIGAPPHPLDAWMAATGFASQIYCDFAGYSTCAIGAALCFGFRLPENFRAPYTAVGFRAFWRRWHISLSTWLRDYLYIPLGGARGSFTRLAMALAVTMLLGGLWHGAQWKFVIWGGLHGCFLIAERGLSRLFGGAPWLQSTWVRAGLAILTYALVCVAWVFFRAERLERAALLACAMLGFGGPASPMMPTIALVKITTATTIVLGSQILLRNQTFEELARSASPRLLTGLWATMLILILLAQAPGDAFIYFQF